MHVIKLHRGVDHSIRSSDPDTFVKSADILYEAFDSRLNWTLCIKIPPEFAQLCVDQSNA